MTDPFKKKQCIRLTHGLRCTRVAMDRSNYCAPHQPRPERPTDRGRGETFTTLVTVVICVMVAIVISMLA